VIVCLFVWGVVCVVQVGVIDRWGDGWERASAGARP